ncbi:MAG: DUF1320 domain-containing protein [Alphaproteobacteria bacterium]|nr:MAG: DUF1320 domain-containing protein [Alphaproteobacteria bacterium]
MAYASYQDLIEAFDEQLIIQMSDDNGDGVADAAVIDQAIASADAEIDASIGTRFAVPLNPVPRLAVRFSCALAVAWLYTRRGVDKPASVLDAERAARDMLKRIAAGQATWGEPVAAAPDTSELDVRTSSATRVFDRGRLTGF